MQSVDRHIIQWTTARFAEVPRGVDVGEHIIAVSHGLVFVIGAQSSTTGSPAELTQGTLGDELFDVLVMGKQHLAG